MTPYVGTKVGFADVGVTVGREGRNVGLREGLRVGNAGADEGVPGL